MTTEPEPPDAMRREVVAGRAVRGWWDVGDYPGTLDGHPIADSVYARVMRYGDTMRLATFGRYLGERLEDDGTRVARFEGITFVYIPENAENPPWNWQKRIINPE